MSGSCKNIVIDDSSEGQRLDNFIFAKVKGVPKSRIYKAIRNGEVRVCSKRKKCSYKLLADDIVRLPPLRVSENHNPDELVLAKLAYKLEKSILHEDDDFLVLNKPSGISVHSGTNQSLGVIEVLRHIRSDLKFLELGHRLDRATSGVLVLLKNRKSLLEFQAQLTDKSTIKKYLCLTDGLWPKAVTKIDKPIATKLVSENNRKMVIGIAGKKAVTLFKIVESFKNHTLVEATLKTGRTHQIRVHTASINCPIVGDTKYGTNKQKSACMMLHASSIKFACFDKKYSFSAPLPEEFKVWMIKNTSV